MVDDLLKELEKGIKAQKTASKQGKADKKNVLNPNFQQSEQPKLNISFDKDSKINVSAKKEDVKEITFKFHPRNVERLAFITIIALLIGFIGYDYTFVHDTLTQIPGTSIKSAEAAASVVKEAAPVKNTTAEKQEEKPAPAPEVKKEEPKAAEAPKPKLSGSIAISIDSVDREKKSDSLGSINSATFSIENGKDEVFFPHVTVIAYDKTTEDAMSDKSRGTYTYPIGIASGGKHTGVITLSPKSFSNLNLEKTVVLVLRDNNANGKVITTASANYLID